MPGPTGSMPAIYPKEEKMLNGNGTSGNGLGQIVPTVAQTDRVEESGTLMPQ